ncbi:hypothetical protein K435DRAFT_831774 [Dendrothele bispora CBS 962.96]|uniref:Cation efflux protein n=1 Tax=Dendrothele bispora (strain CBS 962.96) TaxID=1314807 RepID=A0A4S8L1M5_DENBC|nr:hypothetical protein K435DRAFT_831774 [Dendrothele bispora CBS 962.96]
MTETYQIHRRKSSQGDDENTIMDPPSSPNSSSSSPPFQFPPPPRSRVNSTPAQPVPKSPNNVSGPPPSAGPYRTSFQSHAYRPTSLIGGGQSGSPLRPSFANPSTLGVNGHSRTRSISTPYSPPLPSPLSFSFPAQVKNGGGGGGGPIHPFPSSASAPETSLSGLPGPGQNGVIGAAPPPPKHNRRHSRLHSRNLSIFFPRPGSLPQNTIAEDGSQEIEIKVDEEAPAAAAPESIVPSAGSSINFPRATRPAPPTPLGAGFTFGGRSPRSSGGLSNGGGGGVSPTPPPLGPSSSSSTSTRRGHHHKHSLSHNFFSFLEPQPTSLQTQPTPIPVSPWSPNLVPPPALSSPAPSISESTYSDSQTHVPGQGIAEPIETTPGALAWTVTQFMLGAWMWVAGQQIGSLSCTGVGYWVVFDAFGVGLGNVLPGWLGTGVKSEREKLRRSYGNARVETVFMFAQVVYLMFASVYVCKETVEHVLLSGGGEGHHHHHGDEERDFGVEFPLLLTLLSCLSLIVSAAFFDNHSKLVDITGNRIPSLNSLILSLTSSSSSHRSFRNESPPTTLVGTVLSNPYVSSPLFFCLAILFVSILVSPSQHMAFDLAIAALITFVTFRVAYQASVVLGTVLLQTSPRRGLSSGRMEAFLRAMREIEKHPQVLHLPAPHIWQLTPTSCENNNNPSSSNKSLLMEGKGVREELVVTLELHVRHDLGDEDVLALTRWTWERCAAALQGGLLVGKGSDSKGNGVRADVTVGVVRG